MTIGSSTSRVLFTCDGVSTVFPVPIQSYQATDLSVILTAPVALGGGEALLVLNSTYTLAATGSLTPPQWTLTTVVNGVPTPYAAGYQIQVFSNPLQQQQTQFVQGQAFPSLAVQTLADRLTQMIQRQQDQENRSIRAPDGDVMPTMLLPPAAQRALLSMQFDINGNLVLVTGLPSGTTLSTAALAPFLGLGQTAAETAASVTPVNLFYPQGTVDRYATNLTPGTTNMLAAVSAAFRVAQAQGGGVVSFAFPVDYFLGPITSPTAVLVALTGLSNVTVEGGGARLVSAYSASDPNNVGVWFSFTNSNNLTFQNLRFFDTTANITIDFAAPRCLMFTASGGTDSGQITFENCTATNVLSLDAFINTGTNTNLPRIKGIRYVNHVINTCYYGPNFQSQGDDVSGDVTTINVRRSYFAYGCTGHDVLLNIHHNGIAASANACVIVKRYAFDTSNLRLRTNFHGKPNHQTLIACDIQNGGPDVVTFEGITQVGSITGGSGYVSGVYPNVPLTGGTGTGALAQVTVAAGIVTSVLVTTPGVGYITTDTISASNTSLGGSGSGFSAPVSGTGGVIQDIDFDVHLSDAILAGTSGQSILEFTSYSTTGGVIAARATTTDFWDRITLRGNFGNWNFAQTLNPIKVFSVQTRLGSLGLQDAVFGAIMNEPQVFPGFVIRSGPDSVVYTKAGDLTAAPIFIDLSKYDGTNFDLRILIHAEKDWTLGDTSQSYFEYSVVGSKVLGATVTMSSSVQLKTNGAGTATVPTFTASGNGLNLALTAYNSANSSARVIVQNVSKFL